MLFIIEYTLNNKSIYIMEREFYIESKEELLAKLRYHYDRDAYVF